ncbi:hypothetical protein [Streptomyces sp. enrichment culture]|uniref:hypothetical protein n=1 Tax=Streptomyces sp. enrichment culture TaxID=1795815 RepID=UPI003F55396D
MPQIPRQSDGSRRPTRDELNEAFRRLMGTPAGTERTAEWTRLLTLWAEVTRDDVEPAA